jgi:acyl carrier protein
LISERLKGVILRELKLETAELRDDTVASEVPGWDSLSHVRILTAVEKEFGIQIRALEVIRLKNVGDLQALVERKMAK